MFLNKYKKLLLFAALTLLTQQSRAIFTITPSVGYKMQTVKATTTTDIETEFKGSSPALGLKLGIQSLSGVGFELAGSYVSGKGKSTTAGTEVDQDYTEKTAAAQLSVSTNSFKIYLGYLLLNELLLKDSSGESTFKGPGYQAGLAFNLTRALALEVQYQIDQYNQVKSSAGQSFEDIKDQYKKVDAQSVSLGLTYTF